MNTICAFFKPFHNTENALLKISNLPLLITARTLYNTIHCCSILNCLTKLNFFCMLPANAMRSSLKEWQLV